MFAPGVILLMEDFHSTNSTIASLTVSIYLLGFAFAPLAFAPLSELYGRLIIYHVTSGFFIVFTIACAVSSNMPMFIVFRFLVIEAALLPSQY